MVHPTSTPAAARKADPMGRRRGDYITETISHGYDTFVERYWVDLEDGPLLSSRIGSRLHAPLFDVDHDVRAESIGDGRTQLHIIGPIDRPRLRRNLKALVRTGHVRRSDAEHARLDLRHRIAQTGRFGNVTLTLDHPIRVQASTTPGHHHLYVESPMTFAASRRLARRLAFVDTAYIKGSPEFWVLRPRD